jgi:hypothetical protein
MTRDEYGKAFADMTSEPLDIDERQRLKELGRRYDTAAKRNARTHKRQAALSALLAAHGWPNQSAMLTAMLNGAVEMPTNPNK